MVFGERGRWWIEERLKPCGIKAPSHQFQRGAILGRFNFLQQRYRGFAGISRRWWKVLGGSHEWSWDEERDAAFTKLGEVAVKPAALQFPGQGKPFSVMLSTSADSVGAAPLANGGKGKRVPLASPLGPLWGQNKNSPAVRKTV